ncbi:MAG TPA: SpoIID/LytB domain-containing protein, partial [Candidatus Methylomirabilis sp.]|nr:SpoIID/LytB domain-containing protein [Candidatus Methylomirabilis sp.]
RLLAAGPAVRVLVAEGRASLTVASGGGLTATDASGRRILARRAGWESLGLLPKGDAVVIRGTGTSAPVIVVWPSRLPTLDLEGQSYRGRLELRRLNGSLAAVNVVDLEEYLQGVLKDEIPPGWPTEAARAMAVVARTYAVYQMDQNPGGLFHLRATTASQVYGGATGEDIRTSSAVQATRGQILTFAGQPIAAFYHSCSGGATEDALDVFGPHFDTVIGVRDDFSLSCPYVLWVQRLSPQQVEQGLQRAGYPVGSLQGIEGLQRTRTGRILRLAIHHSGGTLTLEGKRFREALGTDVIRSTDFEVHADSGGFTFVGRGWGHGVGLSQWGAKEMAELAYQYRDILKFYYPLAQISSLDEPGLTRAWIQ